jgi:hypothetical protein
MDRQLIHRDSLFSIRKELDYGQVPPTDASVCLWISYINVVQVIQSEYMELLPTTALEPTSEQFTFTYPASDLFLDLSQTLIRYDCFLIA